MKTSFIKLIALITLLSFSFYSNAQTASADNINPSIYLSGVANQLLAEVKKNQKELISNTKLAETLVRNNLLPAIDSEGFAKRTIGSKNWKSATPEQQKRFVKAFIDLVINSYAKGLSLYKGQTFKFSEPRMSKSGNSAQVRSSMEQSGSTPIVIDYKLSNKTGSWKIYDLTVEGISMLKSYKSQFRPSLAKLGMEKFILDLESKT
ncbi:MAG: ABC transporter substrate-binding protein [Cycloclasticus sp.]|nr:ABC transporter substrate-binding protein [Cycloclasticus sp.]